MGADNYVDGLANLGLQLDPLTGNRYAYAGIDPINLFDDGHGPDCSSLEGRERTRCTNDWVPMKKQLVAAGHCGECAAAYAFFNAAYPEYGLARPGHSDLDPRRFAAMCRAISGVTISSGGGDCHVSRQVCSQDRLLGNQCRWEHTMKIRNPNPAPFPINAGALARGIADIGYRAGGCWKGGQAGAAVGTYYGGQLGAAAGNPAAGAAAFGVFGAGIGCAGGVLMPPGPTPWE